MRIPLFIILYLFTTLTVFSQDTAPSRYYLKLSGGLLSFGTGDVQGYSVQLEVAKNMLRRSRSALQQLLLGIELGHENGVRTAKAINPSVDEFLIERFYQVANTTLHPKLSYYPFKSLLKGFHLAVGPILAYSIQSKERGASVIPNGSGSIRYTILESDKGLLIGYRIGPGFELAITKQIVAGVRVDLANYDNGDVNTFAALKVGVRL
jgi:hypothetical protein